MRLDHIKDAAIADPETGTVPAIYSSFVLQCILGDPRPIVPRKCDKVEREIDIPSLS
jgi:hypothetical protein